MTNHLPRLLHRALHSHANAALQPSGIIQRASPKIESILASYGDGRTKKSDNDASPTSNSASKTRLISHDELKEWKTPDMPILTTRQLELSLLEILRRQHQKNRPQKQNEQPQQPQSTTTNPSKNEAAVLVPLCTVQGKPSILFTRRSAQLSSHASQISFPGGYYDESLDSSEGGWKNRLVNTAVREMHEELKYDINQLGVNGHSNYYHESHDAISNPQTNPQRNQLPFMTILGQTQPVPSMTGSKVTPIIGTINYDLPNSTSAQFTTLFPGNPDEVDWIFTVPICDLISGETSEPLQRWSTNYSDEANGKKSEHEFWGPVFPIPYGDEKREGDKIWGLTAIVLRPLLKRVFGPVFGKDGLGFIETKSEEKIGATAKL